MSGRTSKGGMSPELALILVCAVLGLVGGLGYGLYYEFALGKTLGLSLLSGVGGSGVGIFLVATANS
jgi:hypothetical protein